MVTPELFRRYPDPAHLAKAPLAQIEKIIHSTGFYRNKAKSLKGVGIALTESHAGEVPQNMAELIRLPGVARKTANVVLGNAFGKNHGVVVDTHVSRLTQRMALTRHTDPKKIEKDLMALFPRKNWTLLAHLLIHHGRGPCNARRPDCEACGIRKHCPQVGLVEKLGKA